MLTTISENILLITLITALVYVFQNTVEKYMFDSLNLNINQYLFIRNILMCILFSIIHIYFNKYLLESNKKNNNNNIIHDYKYYIIIFILILLATIFNIIFTHLRIFGIMKYNIGLFNILLNILSIILNVLAGILLFNEKITFNNGIGIIFGIISVYFLN